MNCYGLKVTGTTEEMKLISEVFGYELDENGIINIDEDYQFDHMGDIEKISIDMVRAAKNASFIFRGFLQSEVSGETMNFETEYNGKNLRLCCTEWEEPNYVEEDDLDEENWEEEDFYVDWFKDGDKSSIKWDYEEIKEIDSAKQVDLSIIIAGTSDDDLGTILMANLPVELGFEDIDAAPGRIKIDFTRYDDISKTDLDKLAEAINILIPNKTFAGMAGFNLPDGDMYQYSCEDGVLSCKKVVGKDKETDEYIYESSNMEKLSSEEKQALLDPDDE